jgi:hypothetical protein
MWRAGALEQPVPDVLFTALLDDLRFAKGTVRVVPSPAATPPRSAGGGSEAADEAEAEAKAEAETGGDEKEGEAPAEAPAPAPQGPLSPAVAGGEGGVASLLAAAWRGKRLRKLMRHQIATNEEERDRCVPRSRTARALLAPRPA